MTACSVTPRCSNGRDMVETAWQIVAPIQDVWGALPPRNFPNYPAGTWGPKEAEDLLRRDGRHWSTCD